VLLLIILLLWIASYLGRNSRSTVSMHTVLSHSATFIATPCRRAASSQRPAGLPATTTEDDGRARNFLPFHEYGKFPS
jgi:hypothetical protein